MKFSVLSLSALVVATSARSASQAPEVVLHDDPKAPIVDLVYERHQAIVNSKDKFYNFSNIPYAQPPTGQLRFAKPEFINTTSSEVNDGSIGRICPQATPTWVPTALAFILQWTLGLLDWIQGIPDPSSLFADARISEDCLLLDVVVPQEIYDGKDKDDHYPVPVIVWIHGGGFIFGDKNQLSSPAGIFNASTAADGATPRDDGVIYVTLNYRLGAFGWLSSPEFIQEGGVANLGLWDQRLALDWVQQNIAKFGGDPDAVTVIGESAGAASIMHHLVSFGGPKFGRGKGPRPVFKRAILQSPAFFPQADDTQESLIYSTFKMKAKVNSLEELRTTDSKIIKLLLDANNKMIEDSPYGQFIFGPAVDDDLIPAPPGLLLKHGGFWGDAELMLAHNGNEGLLFTSQLAATTAKFREIITASLPSLDPDDLAKVLEMYPLRDGAKYKERVQRTANASAELAVTCNVQYLNEAYKQYARQDSFKYVFNVQPGFHGQDAFFTFYAPPYANFPKSLPLPSFPPFPPIIPNRFSNFSRVTEGTEVLATALQNYVVNFARYGDPNLLEAYPEFLPSEYGILEFTSEPGSGPLDQIGSIVSREDDIWAEDVRSRCDWWQDAPYWNPKDNSLFLMEKMDL
ncbi:carboxylesterase family protein [Phlyctema vagabunda]|uniref:Carboxylic ester hydrolase n=1 Tax=Phlyctema vagabunda TaxID=108571 RepID=A0ABR4PMP3_9HELO